MKQFANQSGLKIAGDAIVAIKQELAAAFLLNSSARRDAERVTKFELRKMIEEIEQVLGGVFTSLQGDLQDARLERLIFQMQSNEQLPPFPKELVEPTVLTGLEAIGRERDAERGITALDITQNMSPEQQDFIKTDVVLGKVFNGLGIADAIRTQAEVDEIQQRRIEQQAQADAMVRAAPQAVAGAAGAAQSEEGQGQ